MFFSALFTLVFPSSHVVADEYPEANPFNAFNAPISQQIEANSPLFFANLAQPIIRLTITLYANDNDGPSGGFVAVTRSGYRDGSNVTYYFQVSLSSENLGIVTVNVLGPWGNAFSDIVPKKNTDFVFNKNIFTELSYEAKQLWLAIPRSFTIKKVGENQGFVLRTLYGDENFNGFISCPVASVKYYSETQSEQEVFIWAVDGIGIPDLVKWSLRDSKGIFEWRPGYLEPKFVADGIDA